MKRLAPFVAVALLCACGDAREPVQAPTNKVAQPAPAPQKQADFGSWGKFHSSRFHALIPLPEMKAWAIDERDKPYFHATHAATSSDIVFRTDYAHELVNHKACEDRARSDGLLPTTDLRTVESTVTVGPDAFDSRIWVAVEQKSKEGPLVGHLFVFGAFVRRCLFLHLATQVDKPSDEPLLSSRLAAARVTMVSELKLDPPRTTDDADVPRATPPK